MGCGYSEHTGVYAPVVFCMPRVTELAIDSAIVVLPKCGRYASPGPRAIIIIIIIIIGYIS